MKTFAEFSSKKSTAEAGAKTFPTFTQVREGASPAGKCMSENMMEKMNEMYEAMCEEMKSCHEDETENTAETYLKEAHGKMNEMMEKMMKECESYLAAMH